jgi:hypothetical protein
MIGKTVVALAASLLLLSQVHAIAEITRRLAESITFCPIVSDRRTLQRLKILERWPLLQIGASEQRHRALQGRGQ